MKRNLFGAALVVAIATTATAETYKMTTPIPSGIVTFKLEPEPEAAQKRWQLQPIARKE
jgi:streptogramin lyase